MLHVHMNPRPWSSTVCLRHITVWHGCFTWHCSILTEQPESSLDFANLRRNEKQTAYARLQACAAEAQASLTSAEGGAKAAEGRAAVAEGRAAQAKEAEGCAFAAERAAVLRCEGLRQQSEALRSELCAQVSSYS